jgi:NitT/TauT family transport system substrate-binding protein
MANRSGGRAWFLGRVAATTGVLAASRAGAQTTSGNAGLRIAVAPSDGVTSVIYAARTGMFEKAGLDVQIDTQANGAAVAAAIASGSYDIGNSSVTTVLLAHQKGLPFTLVAPAGVHSSKGPLFDGALALKDSPIQLGKDAENQVIGVVSLSGIGHDAFCSWVDQHGGDPALIKFVEIPFSVSGNALEEHRVVAAETATPTMTLALDTGKFRLIPVYNAIAPSFLTSVWFMSKDFSAKRPEVVRTFTRVVAAAAVYANGHHAETAAIMSDFTRIPLATVLRMPRSLEGVTLNPELIQPVITAAAKYGLLKKTFPAQELIDPSLLS